MKIILFALILALWVQPAAAQYYYKDILGNQQLIKEYKLIIEGQAHKISLQSFEDDDSPSQGFFCERVFNKDFSKSEMISRSYMNEESDIKADYKNGRIVSSTTTTPHSTHSTRFTYDTVGRLIKIQNSTWGNADSTRFTEERTYEYNSAGRPVKMKRVKNGIAASEVEFVQDAQGNTIEEHAPDQKERKYYYYYDDHNRLTDVVHFNEWVQKLLPDYMFQYGDQDLPAQMISVEETGTNYYIWKYAYTVTGLPEIQKCYSKEKRLLGTIQYEYQ